MFTFISRGNYYRLDLRNNILYDGNSVYKLDTSTLDAKKQTYLKFSSECNLNCIYCFQKFDKKVNNKGLVNYKDYVLESLLSDSDEIILFGGEPFLDKNIYFIKEILRYIKESSLDISVITFTNGCHSTNYINLLVEYSHVFSNIIITMDGPKQIHDNRRILKNLSSYDLILTNVKSYLENNIKFSISVIIDQYNIDYLDELFENLNDMGRIFANNICVTLIEGKHYNNLLDEIEILKSFISFKEKYNMLYFKTSIKMLDKLSDYISNRGVTSRVCNAGVTKVYDFETGKIYTCPQDAKSEIGKFSKSNICLDDKKIDMVISKLDKNEIYICEKCEYKFLCDYGCPHSKKIDFNSCKDLNMEKLKFILNNFDLIYDL